ncbi:hypothetical protein LJC47_07410 [Desulfosarcina sp. OttesenSCG-928-B08]|nr:hypothetical protein [Desulfosarcina sp. OttesenSCG-928-B08]
MGWVFTTLGAFGGIMAGIGHMSVYGLGDYARSFKGSASELNGYVTNSVRGSILW